MASKSGIVENWIQQEEVSHEDDGKVPCNDSTVAVIVQ